jgi:excisionase family DNA binding protein
VNQSRNCAALSSSEKEQPEETEASADDRSGRPMVPLLLKAGQVAQLLGLGRSTVFALLAAGELPVIRIGRSVRVPRVALERWVNERTDHVANQGDVRGPLIQDLGDRHPVDGRHSWPPPASLRRAR